MNANVSVCREPSGGLELSDTLIVAWYVTFVVEVPAKHPSAPNVIPGGSGSLTSGVSNTDLA